MQGIGAFKFDSLSKVANVEDIAVLCVAAELGPLGIVVGRASVPLSSFCYLGGRRQGRRRDPEAGREEWGGRLRGEVITGSPA